MDKVGSLVGAWAEQEHRSNELAMESFRSQQEVWNRNEKRARDVADAASATLRQASEAVKDILQELQYFERSIDVAEEARVVVIGGPAGHAIFPQTIRPQGHDRILFAGLGQDGCRVVVLQHVSQLNLMLKAVRVGIENARRIGFHSPSEEQGS